MVKKTASVLLPILLGIGLYYFEMRVVLREAAKAVDRLNSEDAVVEISRSGGSPEIRLMRDDLTGMVHVDAKTDMDMYFGYGYAQARDRLFQLEILRRLSKGELAELVGENALKVDIWQRTMGFAQLAELDWQTLQKSSPGVAEELQAFIDGINTYLKKRSHSLLSMPLDLLLLGCIPKPFTPVEAIMFHRWHASALNKGWQNEPVFSTLYSDLDKDVVELLRSVVRYDSEKVGNGDGMASTLEKDPDAAKATADASFVGMYTNSGGSNAWVIHGNHTKSGRPILANDPHLPFSQPSIWKMVRLTSPNIDSSGLGAPLAPYVIAGYNKHVAYGITLGRADVDDLFLEKISNASDGSGQQFLEHDGTLRPVATRAETLKVKGSHDRHITVKSTSRGPLVCHLLGYRNDCSLSALVLQKPENMLPSGLQSFRMLMYSKNWKDFVSGIQVISYYQLNFVYADKAGNIGYHMSGRIPVRETIGDGMREGWNPKHQWGEWYPLQALPHALNPESGYIISSNQKPHMSKHADVWLGDIWQHGWRNKRIAELVNSAIASGVKIDTDMTAAWQRDLVSIPARRFAAAVASRLDTLLSHSESPTVRKAFTLTSAWDGSMLAQSPEPTLYAAFKEQMLRDVLSKAVVGSNVTVDELMGIGLPSIGKLVNDLEGRHSAMLLRLLEGEAEVRSLLNGEAVELVMVRAMQGACARLEAASGHAEVSQWLWGKYHVAEFSHPLGKAGFPLNLIFNVDAGEVPGDVDTVSLAAYLHQDTEVPSLPLPTPIYSQRGFAASVRMIVNFDTPHDIHLIVSPGNSGRISSPHYDPHKDILTCPVDRGVPRVSLGPACANTPEKCNFTLETTLLLN